MVRGQHLIEVFHGTAGRAVFDCVVFACPADRVLGALSQPSLLESWLLSMITYTDEDDRFVVCRSTCSDRDV